MSSTDSLTEIFWRHSGNLSDKWEHYLAIYEAHLRHFVDQAQPVSLLEIGVQNGGSLQIWRSYLPEGSTILGVDIDPACAELDLGGGIEIVVCDASSRSDMDKALAGREFDIIIDDGSHQSGDIIETFLYGFERLRAGGIYVVEDLHCSYDPAFGGGFRRPDAAVEFFKRLSDGLNFDHFRDDDEIDSKEIDILKRINENISRIVFYDSVIIVELYNSTKMRPYRRVMSGKDQPVVDHTSIIAGLTSSHARDFLLSPSVIPSIAPLFLDRIEAAGYKVGELQSNIDRLLIQVPELEQSLSDARQDANELRSIVEKQDILINELQTKFSVAEGLKNEAEVELVSVRQRLSTAEQLVSALMQSSSWKLTHPVRRAALAQRAVSRVMNRGRLAMKAYGGLLPMAGELTRRVRRDGAVITVQRIVANAVGNGMGVPLLSDNTDRLLHEAFERFQAGNMRPASINCDRKFTIIMPVYNTPPNLLERTIETVRYQSYPNWELQVVDDGSTNEAVADILRRYARLDSRIVAHLGRKNGGISEASNVGLQAATGDYIALLDHDDELTWDALESVAAALLIEPEADILYSDECKIDPLGKPTELFSKPDWSPALLTNCMYIGHLTVYRRELINQSGGFRSEYDFSQDYDLALRATELTKRITHIPRVLYGWRAIPESAAAGGKPYARQTNIAALQDAIDRRGWSAKAFPADNANRLDWAESRAEQHFVSIIVPSDNVTHIKETINSIESNTLYQEFEIIVVTNSKIILELENDPEVSNVRYVAFDEPFNFSKKCNVGAASARGSLLCFYNDDVRVLKDDWLHRLTEIFDMDGVGAVGPKMLYEDGTIQHAGMVTGVRRLVGTAFHALPEDTNNHFNFAQSLREVSLLCGACILVPASVFQKCGGFDWIDAPISHSDVDLCFRIRDLGYRCVYTPHATLLHKGHVSIGAEEQSSAKKLKVDKSNIHLLRRWPEMTARDPYYTEPMRNVLYRDSPEPFEIFPGNRFVGDTDAKDILLVSHDLSSSGAPRVVLEMARCLASQGHFVVVASPVDGPMRHELKSLGLSVIVDDLLMRRHDSVFDFAKDFDLIIANTAVTWPIVSQMNGIVPVIWYIHEIELLQRLAGESAEFRRIVTKAENLWAGSMLSVRKLEALGGKAQVVEYGLPNIDVSIRHSRPETSSHLTLSVFGSYEERKGQDLLIEAIKMLDPEERARIRVEFHGRTLDPKFRDHLASIVTPGLPITFFGEISHDDYLKKLAGSSMVIVPSRHDTLPLVSLNALDAGVPLMCTTSSGTSEYLVDGVSGFIVPAAEPEAISRTIRNALQIQSQWQQIGDAGKSVFEARFSSAAFDKRLAEAVSDLTSHSRAPEGTPLHDVSSEEIV